MIPKPKNSERAAVERAMRANLRKRQKLETEYLALRKQREVLIAADDKMELADYFREAFNSEACNAKLTKWFAREGITEQYDVPLRRANWFTDASYSLMYPALQVQFFAPTPEHEAAAIAHRIVTVYGKYPVETTEWYVDVRESTGSEFGIYSIRFTDHEHARLVILRHGRESDVVTGTLPYVVRYVSLHHANKED